MQANNVHGKCDNMIQALYQAFIECMLKMSNKNYALQIEICSSSEITMNMTIVYGCNRMVLV